MSVDPIEENAATPERSRWQFSLRRMFVATTAVAVVFSVAAWGGWAKRDAAVYLAIAVLAGIFWPARTTCPAGGVRHLGCGLVLRDPCQHRA